MSADIPTDEPSTIRAGDGLTWSKALSNYLPSAGWVLKYRLLYADPPSFAFQAADGGNGSHLVQLSSATTSTWRAGAATLVSWVENGAQRVTLEQLPVTVLPDLTAATALDGRTVNEKALAAAEKALSDYVAGGQSVVEEYEIAGRRMRFRDSAQITALIDYYRAQVTRERALRAALNGATPGRIYTRF